jgi:hypothetical protein
MIARTPWCKPTASDYLKGIDYQGRLGGVPPRRQCLNNGGMNA